jgi:xanthine dehydrogenase accessory factor
MKALELEVLQRARVWLEHGQTVFLCTIVEAIGSSPRPIGSLLACTDSGEQVGSLSGGCVEEDLLEKISSGDLSDKNCHLIEYGVTAQENERLGLPCGGRLHILLQVLLPEHISSDWLEPALLAMQRRDCLRRTVSVESGTTELDFAESYQALTFTGDILQQSFGPRMRMLLVGAGQLSHSLAELAVAMDYEVVVTDPREQMLQQWAGPDVTLMGGMPDDAVRHCCDDQHSIVITLTHDPRIDDMALMEALTSKAWYVGALGSKKTTQQRLLRLAQLDISKAQLASLHAPVGLDIGSKTPMEIAISIVAELTALRRKGERSQ